MKKIILILALFSTTLLSQLTSVFNLQGVLRTPTGKAATDGDYRFTFRLFDGQESVTRIGSWTETQTIRVTNGIYNALIGSVTPFSGLAFDRTYFVEIEVGGSTLRPRIQLTASPYALSLQGTNNKVPNSGAMQFDKDVWHKSSDGRDRIKFVNNGETQINSRVKDQYGFLVPAGTIVAFAGSTAPDGWLICNGAIISRSNYSELFAVLGTNFNYGTVDGSSFRLPNLNGKSITGVGISVSTAWNASTGDYNANSPEVTLGQYFGRSNHKITEEELASHKHVIGADWWTGDSPNTGGIDSDRRPNSNLYGASTNYTGGNQPHNNLSPSLGLNYIIKY